MANKQKRKKKGYRATLVCRTVGSAGNAIYHYKYITFDANSDEKALDVAKEIGKKKNFPIVWQIWKIIKHRVPAKPEVSENIFIQEI